jgi:hypothetical protein
MLDGSGAAKLISGLNPALLPLAKLVVLFATRYKAAESESASMLLDLDAGDLHYGAGSTLDP